MIKTCCTHKEAQFICINEFCKQKSSYVCSTLNDPCKQQHQSCSLISLNYLTKKCSKISYRQNSLNMKQLQKLYDQCKKITQRLQNFFEERQNALKMKNILDPHGLLQQDEKNVVINFVKGYQKRQNQSVDESLLSPASVEKQLMSLSLEITSYLKYLKDESVLNTYNGSFDQGSPLRSQTKIMNKKFDSQKKQGSAIDKIKCQNKGPTPVKSANIFDIDNSPLKSSQLQKIQNPTKTNSGPFESKLTSTIKGHVPLGPLFSNITNDIESLQSFFHEKFKGGNLLYRASQNDFLVSKFHQKCDGKRNTLTLLITEFDKIIGGFTPLPWKMNGDWFDDEALSSFIFSLSLGEKFPLKGKSKAIWCNHAYGPSFGYPDLEIANRAFSNQNSCVNFPQFYNNGNYTHGPSSNQLLCGSNTGRFRIKQWEVYELQF